MRHHQSRCFQGREHRYPHMLKFRVTLFYLTPLCIHSPSRWCRRMDEAVAPADTKRELVTGQRPNHHPSGHIPVLTLVFLYSLPSSFWN